MVQIKCLSNGLYSLKNSHIPFGKGFQPPPLTAEFRLNIHFFPRGLPLFGPECDVSVVKLLGFELVLVYKKIISKKSWIWSQKI